MTLSRSEFIRRWCLHILPKGYVKTRRYGGWSNKHQENYLNRCRHHFVDSESEEPDDSIFVESSLTCRCPQCGEEMELLLEEVKPSWSDLRGSASWPSWYQEWG